MIRGSVRGGASGFQCVASKIRTSLPADHRREEIVSATLFCSAKIGTPHSSSASLALTASDGRRTPPAPPPPSSISGVCTISTTSISCVHRLRSLDLQEPPPSVGFQVGVSKINRIIES
ncbi:hypothetical protein L6452_27934 [Arctium lappa]|uniref:Uncharacterized protein n=1 Tax=Arctium lappa TaxID=4217 RepID=A0ACB8ZXB6_ARCLA|nr:hypothetical protein L6452_27934 [Arctium lappa]